MSVRAVVQGPSASVQEVVMQETFRMHTIACLAVGGYVTLEVMVPGGQYEPVMDSDTNAALQMTGSESVTLEEMALSSIRFTPSVGATYSATVTSQGAD